jgi:uncharacterized protein (TIGR02678 family)
MSRQKVRKHARTDSHSIGLSQERFLREEFCRALRALLLTPLMTAAHPDFATVRRHASELQEWFTREAGWPLQVGRDCARLYKRPGDLLDDTRGLPGYDRRHYVLFCLACAVLERAEPQITLRHIGERVLALAAEPTLAWHNFTFTLEAQHERRELVAVCRTLLELSVLQRVAGDEEAYLRANGADGIHDALYDIRRRALAGLLAAVRGPSTWSAADSPVGFEDRLQSLVAEYVLDSDEGRRTALRHMLSRRLLDDPVLYFDSLDAGTLAYFINQRGLMAARLAEAAGLTPEQRAEGVALTDEESMLTDLAMPAEGTEAHVTLLVAEFIAAHEARLNSTESLPPLYEADVANFIANARQAHGSYWRKSAKESGSEHELAKMALARLRSLQLIVISEWGIQPRPALARFASGTIELVTAKIAVPQPSLFETP